VGGLNKEIRLGIPDRPCPKCSNSIPGKIVATSRGLKSGFECPTCRARLRSGFSNWHVAMSVVLSALAIIGLLWLGSSFDDLDSGRSIRGAERRVFVNVLRGALLFAVFVVVGGIVWIGNRLPFRVTTEETPDPQSRAIDLAVLIPPLLLALMIMVTCVRLVVSSG